MNTSRLRPSTQVRSTSTVQEDLSVKDGYQVGSTGENSLEQDLNYLRTTVKNLKGIDTTEVDGYQLHFSSDHAGVQVVGDGYGQTKGLPVVDAISPNSINHTLWLLNDKVGGGSGVGIGPAEDGSYTDGLFTDFVPVTPVGTAVDRFNEVLKALSPSPPPFLSSKSLTQNGTSGKLSFGVINTISGYTNVGATPGAGAVDINGAYNTNGYRRGIFAPAVKSGTLADNIPASTQAPTPAYPANAFQAGDQGTLKLEVNGSVVHTVTLSSFGSGATVNGNGSGFILLVATAIKFPSGTDLDLFKYRTGTYTVAIADQRNGWNYIRVIHTVNAVDKTTTYFEWVNDAQTDATSYSGASVHDLSLTGSRYISGVRYYTGGTAQYDITGSNVHRDTYSSSASAVTHPTATNCDVANAALANISLETDQEAIVNKSVTVNPDTDSRILGGDLSITTTIDRTVQTDVTSSAANGGWRILLDNHTSAATNAAEDFILEAYRQASNLSLTNVSYSASPGSQPSVWTNTESLVGSTPGYTDGLLIYNDMLVYPKLGIDSGDFRNVADGNAAGGPTTVGGYTGNPNYNAATGERTYIRYFYDASSRQNFTFNMTVASTTFVVASNKGSLSGNQVCAEVLAPNTTKDGGGTVEWKDMVSAYTTDSSIGAYASTYGSTIPTNWGVSLGTKSTATSGYVIVVKITAPATWSGNISNISITML